MPLPAINPESAGCSQRIENLAILADCCGSLNIPCWLSGRTHLYVHSTSTLPGDEFDSMGVRMADDESMERLASLLEKKGFSLVAADTWNLLLRRNERQLEVGFFRPLKEGLLFRETILPMRHFTDFSEIEIEGRGFNIPKAGEILIDSLFHNAEAQWFFADSPLVSRDAGLRKKVLKYAGRAISVLPGFLVNWIRRVRNGQRCVVLTEQEFRQLYFEQDPVNWLLRKPHLALVTDSGKYQTVGDIIEYLESPGVLDSLKQEIIETRFKGRLLEPVYFNKHFWQSGNNFFINCILYSFRKNVIPYEEINEHLSPQADSNLFSSEYYAPLPRMTDNEARLLLEAKPISIHDRSITAGRHRVCAMIGRLISGDSYLPVHATVSSS